MVLVQGLDVSALAVNVLLIYFSKTARHITKESESGGRMGGGSAILLASYSILHYFHFASKIIPQKEGVQWGRGELIPFKLQKEMPKLPNTRAYFILWSV